MFRFKVPSLHTLQPLLVPWSLVGLFSAFLYKHDSTVSFVLFLLVNAWGAYWNRFNPLNPLYIIIGFVLTVLVDQIVGVYRETFETKRSKPKRDVLEKLQDEDGDEEESVDEQFEALDRKNESDASKTPHMDLGSTWMNAYNKLSPEMVQSMRKDTKELMETQKNLMQSIGTMGPAITEGMELLKSFKQYFPTQN